MYLSVFLLVKSHFQANCIKTTMFVLRLAVLCFIAGVFSEDNVKPPPVEILTEKSFVRQDGYNFLYKTSDGVSREEEGQLIEVGEHKGIGVKGSYSYIGSDGLHYRVTFVADDKGYRPELHIDHPQN